MDVMAAAWLDRIFKLLLPISVYKKALSGKHNKYVKRWLLDHGIAIAQEDGVIAVLREGQIYAVWKPELLPNPKK